MLQNIFIIGATGKVGSALVKQVYGRGDTRYSIHANPTRVVGLASSSSLIFSKSGISEKRALEFTKKGAGLAYKNLDELLLFTKDSCGDVVFVDTTAAGESMIAFHKKVISKTPHSIVTANKNPIACSDYKTFTRLTKEPGRYGYRCSVMAGADAVPFLRDLRDVRDELISIDGCFSGTLGYIAATMDKGASFSSILRRAWECGYTEPDPRDDLSGLDVAKKLVALARSAGYPVELTDVRVNPFIPRAYFKKESVKDFLGSVGKIDAYLGREVSNAKRSKCVLRYVASVCIKKNVPHLTVGLRSIPRDSQLGTLQGTLNKIIVVSKIYGKENPYSVQGPGAGLEVTAQNIRRDLLYLLRNRVVAH